MQADNAAPRSEVITEYFKLVDRRRAHDARSLTIKRRSVGLWVAATGIGFIQNSPPMFLLAALLAVGCWATGVRFELRHIGHTRGAR